MVTGWLIKRDGHEEWLYIRQGRYIEWTKVRDDALQFHRNEDAGKFAEFYFGTTLHGHSVIAYGELSS